MGVADVVVVGGQLGGVDALPGDASKLVAVE